MKYLLFILGLFMMASCGGAGKELSDNITFGQAWKYAWTLPAYYVWVIISVVGGAIVGYFLKKNYDKKQDWSTGHSVILFVLVALFFAALLAAPAGIAANTTVEQASRGVYIR